MRRFKEIPEELKQFIAYSEDSPSGLVWIKSTNRKIKIGTPVGCLKPTGYWEIRFNKKEYLAHRVVVFLVEGRLSSDTIVDHKDGNTQYNLYSNLRTATPEQSSHNTSGWSKKKDLPKGISWDKRLNGYMTAQIMVGGSVYSKGSYDLTTLCNWLEDLRSKVHKEFTNHGT